MSIQLNYSGEQINNGLANAISSVQKTGTRTATEIIGLTAANQQINIGLGSHLSLTGSGSSYTLDVNLSTYNGEVE